MSQSETRKPGDPGETEEERTEPVLEPAAGVFRFIDVHPVSLDSGQPIAPGEIVTFETEADAKKNKRHFEEGHFLDAAAPAEARTSKDKGGGN
jgi:hypothetical protein